MKFHLFLIQNVGMAVVPNEQLADFYVEQALQGNTCEELKQSDNRDELAELALEYVFLNMLGMSIGEQPKRPTNPIVQTSIDIEMCAN